MLEMAKKLMQEISANIKVAEEWGHDEAAINSYVDNQISIMLEMGIRYTICNAIIRMVGYGHFVHPTMWEV